MTTKQPFRKSSPLFVFHILLTWLVGVGYVLGGFDSYYTTASEDEGTPPKVRFDYKLTPKEAVKSVTVKADGEELFPKLVTYSDDPEVKTAVLFLIDTSNPRRKKEVEQAQKLVMNVLSKADEGHHNIGIYPFHGQIDESFAPMGTPLKDLKEKAKGIKANGINTILYGSVMKAIGILEKTEANRKAIVVISDWKSEDNVMGTKEFVASAVQRMTDGKIVCHSVVLVEEDQSELDTAEKLSDVTGGTFVKVSKRKIVIPSGFSGNLLGNLENGGSAVVDMSGREQAKKVVLEVVTEGDKTYSYEYDREAKIEKDVTPADPDAAPDANPAADPDATPGDGDADNDPESDDPAAPDGDETDTEAKQSTDDEEEGGLFGLPIWMVLGAIALAIIALIVLVFLLTRNKGGDDFDESFDTGSVEGSNEFVDGDQTVIMAGDELAAVPPPAPQYPGSFELGNGMATCNTLPAPGESVVASLQFGEGGSRGAYPISKTAVRIGRGSDNDLSLNNDSVSRHHAEILCKRDGTFAITDLDSGNGVYVNGQEITQTSIKAGDRVEIGEVAFTFTV